MLEGIGARMPTLRHLWVDAGYQGPTVAWMDQDLGLSVTVTRKPRRWRWQGEAMDLASLPTGFQLLPRRWVVERTFAWLGRSRRLRKDTRHYQPPKKPGSPAP